MEKQCQTFINSPTGVEMCPHFNGCSQNFCPLDSDLNLRSGVKQDVCRFMREPKLVNIRGREFVSGGTVMPDTPLILVPRSNLERLNTQSQNRWKELTTSKEIR